MTSAVDVLDPYYIVAETDGRDAETRVIKQGDTFAVFDPFGDIAAGGQQGLYHEGTRYLSGCELRLAGHRPFLLGSTPGASSHVLTVDLTNPDIRDDDAGRLAQGHASHSPHRVSLGHDVLRSCGADESWPDADGASHRVVLRRGLPGPVRSARDAPCGPRPDAAVAPHQTTGSCFPIRDSTATCARPSSGSSQRRRSGTGGSASSTSRSRPGSVPSCSSRSRVGAAGRGSRSSTSSGRACVRRPAPLTRCDRGWPSSARPATCSTSGSSDRARTSR